jgi:hypothetical protein
LKFIASTSCFPQPGHGDVGCTAGVEPCIGRAGTRSKPDAGGVLIEPEEGDIEPGTALTFIFATAMVGADRIDVADQPIPFVSNPQLDGGLLWKSTTECVFTVQGVIPAAKYRLSLAPGLTDAGGRPLADPDWSAEFTTPPFNITTDFEESEHLSSRPQIPLESTYAVRFSEVAEHSYFQVETRASGFRWK